MEKKSTDKTNKENSPKPKTRTVLRKKVVVGKKPDGTPIVVTKRIVRKKPTTPPGKASVSPEKKKKSVQAGNTSSKKFNPVKSVNTKPTKRFAIGKSAVITIAILLGGFFISGLLVATKEEKTIEKRKPTGIRSSVLTIKRSDIQESLWGYGKVKPVNQCDIVAEIPGRVIYVHPGFEIGGLIRKGEILIRIDSEPYQLELSAAKALEEETEEEINRLGVEKQNLNVLLKNSEEQAAVAKKEYDLSAAQKGVVPDSTINAARLVWLRQREALENIKNRIRLMDPNERKLKALKKTRQMQTAQAQRRMNLTEIHAPFTGIVTAKTVLYNRQISNVSISDPLGRLVDPHDLEVPIELPSNQAGSLPVGTKARITSDDFPGIAWQGTVVRISPEINNSSRTLPVYLKLNNSDQNIPPKLGTFVKAVLPGKDHHDVAVLPIQAMFEGTVFVLDSNNRVYRRNIRTKQLTPSFLLIEDGLKEGDRIALTRLDELFDGILVDPQDAKDIGTIFKDGFSSSKKSPKQSHTLDELNATKSRRMSKTASVESGSEK